MGGCESTELNASRKRAAAQEDLRSRRKTIVERGRVFSTVEEQLAKGKGTRRRTNNARDSGSEVFAAVLYVLYCTS